MSNYISLTLQFEIMLKEKFIKELKGDKSGKKTFKPNDFRIQLFGAVFEVEGRPIPFHIPTMTKITKTTSKGFVCESTTYGPECCHISDVFSSVYKIKDINVEEITAEYLSKASQINRIFLQVKEAMQHDRELEFLEDYTTRIKSISFRDERENEYPVSGDAVDNTNLQLECSLMSIIQNSPEYYIEDIIGRDEAARKAKRAGKSTMMEIFFDLENQLYKDKEKPVEIKSAIIWGALHMLNKSGHISWDDTRRLYGEYMSKVMDLR